MNTYNSLLNNLEALELRRFQENIDKYLDMIADGSKTVNGIIKPAVFGSEKPAVFYTKYPAII